jgi:hypothetical protein
MQVLNQFDREMEMAFRELRLQINRHERTCRQHRPEQYHDMSALDSTVVQIKSFGHILLRRTAQTS